MDINIRESSVLGMIGAGGIGSALMVDIRLFFQYKQAVVAIGMIFLLILCVEYMTAKDKGENYRMKQTQNEKNKITKNILLLFRICFPLCLVCYKWN